MTTSSGMQHPRNYCFKQCAKSENIQLTYCNYYLFFTRGRFGSAKQESKYFDLTRSEIMVNLLIFKVYRLKSKFLYLSLRFLTLLNSIIY